MAELKDPKDYPKSLCLLQGIDLVLYMVASVVIYCYAGQDVTSPALGSASPIVRKVAYGIALPTVSIPTPYCRHTINTYRSSSPASSTATSHASTSTSASSATAIACTSATGSQPVPGSRLELWCGCLRGLSPRRFRFSITCLV